MALWPSEGRIGATSLSDLGLLVPSQEVVSRDQCDVSQGAIQSDELFHRDGGIDTRGGIKASVFSTCQAIGQIDPSLTDVRKRCHIDTTMA
jgi:hypothetical protein